MAVALGAHADEQSLPLDRAVVELVRDLALAEAERSAATGCLVHASGKVKWAGGVWQVKRVMFEYTHGHQADDVMLVRRCAEPHCIEPGCHVSQTRTEFGRWLGAGRGWRQRASA